MITNMPTNPFFSGRIPQELHSKVEEYCSNTGKTKTELLIYALSTVLDFPITSQNTKLPSQSIETINDLFNLLEQRVQDLEQKTVSHGDSIQQVLYLLDFKSPQIVINHNLIDNDNDNKQPEETLEIPSVIIHDNIFDNSLDSCNRAQEADDILGDNNLDLAATPKTFNSVTSTEVVEIAKITIKQINAFKGNAIQKLKKQGETLANSQLLKNPIIIEPKKPININGCTYKLEYLGENPQGNTLWNLTPNEVRSNHSGTIEFDCDEITIGSETPN